MKNLMILALGGLVLGGCAGGESMDDGDIVGLFDPTTGALVGHKDLAEGVYFFYEAGVEIPDELIERVWVDELDATAFDHLHGEEPRVGVPGGAFVAGAVGPVCETTTWGSTDTQTTCMNGTKTYWTMSSTTDGQKVSCVGGGDTKTGSLYEACTDTMRQ